LAFPYGLGAVAVLSGLLSVAGFAFLVSPAQSTPEYLQAFNKKYGTQGTKLDSCITCHTSPSGGKDNLNPYGKDFGSHNHDFTAIEPLDSDGDGFSNIDEIKAGTFPGDPNDNPKTQKQKAPPSSTTTTTKPGVLPHSAPGLPGLPGLGH
jgi:hypothetical protein